MSDNLHILIREIVQVRNELRAGNTPENLIKLYNLISKLDEAERNHDGGMTQEEGLLYDIKQGAR